MDTVSLFNLGAFSSEEKAIIKSDFTYNKAVSQILKNAHKVAKRDTCYYCGKKVSSFCNSHSIPRFILENIATNGDVLTLNTIVDNPCTKTEDGIKRVGTFQLICKECDSKIFSDYENPDNYIGEPTSKMISQIALKNALKSISKRLVEIEIYNSLSNYSEIANVVTEEKNTINKLDLNEYEIAFKKAKKSLEKHNSEDYYVCFYEKLNYVTPIAIQTSLALTLDFEGNVINDIYNKSPSYEIHYIHINIFPLKSETVIMMFVENNDKRYRKFYKQFRKLSKEEQLAALCLIIFMYSEDMYFSESIKNIVLDSPELCEVGKMGQDIISLGNVKNPLRYLSDSFSLDKMYSIPNLLSEKYKLIR